MTQFITADFSSLNGVRDVRISQDHDRFTVEAFYREFPALNFSFYLVDASSSAPDNAIAQ
ncbi:MAG: hypothetical protein ABSH56_16625 [Bryobacteraceae bacterium]